jgi:hypothetical protein
MTDGRLFLLVCNGYFNHMYLRILCFEILCIKRDNYTHGKASCRCAVRHTRVGVKMIRTQYDV